MSQKHPVIAVTGSSGAGTSTVKNSFEHIFRREKLTAVVVEGDSFHRYDRDAMKKAVAESEKDGGRPISHLVPKPMSSRNWKRFSTSMAKPAQVKLACICTMMMKRRLTSKKLAPLPHGRHLPPVQTSCFMRDCMAESRATLPMSPSM